MHKTDSKKKNTPWYSQSPIAGMFFIIGLSMAFSYLIYFRFPDLIPYIIEEDHLIENLSAFFYLLSFFLALRVLRTHRAWWKFSLLVAVMGLIGFLDEISFGERIFNLDMPVILGVKVDALHDFVAIIYISLKETFGFYGLSSMLFGLLILLTSVYTYQQKFTLKDLFGDFFTTSPGKLLFLFFFILITATVIDLKEDFIPFIIIEELFEMFAGVALCLCPLSLADMEEKLIVPRSETIPEKV